MMRAIQPNHIEVRVDGITKTFTWEQAESILANSCAMLDRLKTLVRVVQGYENPLNIATSAQLDALEIIAKVERR